MTSRSQAPGGMGWCRPSWMPSPAATSRRPSTVVDPRVGHRPPAGRPRRRSDALRGRWPTWSGRPRPAGDHRPRDHHRGRGDRADQGGGHPGRRLRGAINQEKHLDIDQAWRFTVRGGTHRGDRVLVPAAAVPAARGQALRRDRDRLRRGTRSTTVQAPARTAVGGRGRHQFSADRAHDQWHGRAVRIDADFSTCRLRCGASSGCCAAIGKVGTIGKPL